MGDRESGVAWTAHPHCWCQVDIDVLALILQASSEMLSRQPTHVEKHADVAAEYEAYLQEKERKSKSSSSSSKTNAQQTAPAFESMAARREARRQDLGGGDVECLLLLLLPSLLSSCHSISPWRGVHVSTLSSNVARSSVGLTAFIVRS
ncbi:hypothetical protein PF005_g13295 [Phytophthora fragariae]|uniref:Uncharacterized protein n=1 Tax=Phytophthora fragariae TaxID=53985 RepID=A0A6A4DAM8_9STRA|nr:hypothetical protein PF009_g15285 [Phytophthora fragariae]KAE9104163.1 hypothetical protein PF010_g13483 [Phytophthora fragariae]KAE9106810.1 hypothetical protein PF007_g13267 [Phytophthora fragariae]KAE9142052.1 hypothetical protein PF006_g12811 [Phytophthora fragariae]KAE9205710.1 hypothetical protein PF005_g13295 [Phytophthora fragariae]